MALRSRLPPKDRRRLQRNAVTWKTTKASCGRRRHDQKFWCLVGGSCLLIFWCAVWCGRIVAAEGEGGEFSWDTSRNDDDEETAIRRRFAKAGGGAAAAGTGGDARKEIVSQLTDYVSEDATTTVGREKRFRPKENDEDDGDDAARTATTDLASAEAGGAAATGGAAEGEAAAGGAAEGEAAAGGAAEGEAAAGGAAEGEAAAGGVGGQELKEAVSQLLSDDVKDDAMTAVSKEDQLRQSDDDGVVEPLLPLAELDGGASGTPDAASLEMGSQQKASYDGDDEAKAGRKESQRGASSRDSAQIEVLEELAVLGRDEIEQVEAVEKALKQKEKGAKAALIAFGTVSALGVATAALPSQDQQMEGPTEGEAKLPLLLTVGLLGLLPAAFVLIGLRRSAKGTLKALRNDFKRRRALLQEALDERRK